MASARDNDMVNASLGIQPKVTPKAPDVPVVSPKFRFWVLRGTSLSVLIALVGVINRVYPIVRSLT